MRHPMSRAGTTTAWPTGGLAQAFSLDGQSGSVHASTRSLRSAWTRTLPSCTADTDLPAGRGYSFASSGRNRSNPPRWPSAPAPRTRAPMSKRAQRARKAAVLRTRRAARIATNASTTCAHCARAVAQPQRSRSTCSAACDLRAGLLDLGAVKNKVANFHIVHEARPELRRRHLRW